MFCQVFTRKYATSIEEEINGFFTDKANEGNEIEIVQMNSIYDSHGDSTSTIIIWKFKESSDIPSIIESIDQNLDEIRTEIFKLRQDLDYFYNKMKL